MSCRNLPRAAMLCTLLFLSFIVYSQDKVISGKVTDSKDGSAIPGVTVTAKGTNTAAQSSVDGSYKITVANSVTTLVFTSVGFTTQEIALDGKTTVNVTLAVNNAALG